MRRAALEVADLEAAVADVRPDLFSSTRTAVEQFRWQRPDTPPGWSSVRPLSTRRAGIATVRPRIRAPRGRPGLDSACRREVVTVAIFDRLFRKGIRPVRRARAVFGRAAPSVAHPAHELGPKSGEHLARTLLLALLSAENDDRAGEHWQHPLQVLQLLLCRGDLLGCRG